MPDMMGTDLVRLARFEGNRLIISTEPDARGRVSVITWERVASE